MLSLNAIVLPSVNMASKQRCGHKYTHKQSDVIMNNCLANNMYISVTPTYAKHYIISRVIALPSVKYSGRVETDVFESRLGWGKIGREPACRENNK